MKRLMATLFLIFTPAIYSYEQQNQLDIGQCSEKDRSDYVNAADFGRTWKACGKGARGNAGKTTKCLLHNYVGLSQQCAQCFGDYVGCAKSHCWSHCWTDPDGADCEVCSNERCQPDLVSCSGILAPDLPRHL